MGACPCLVTCDWAVCVSWPAVFVLTLLRDLSFGSFSCGCLAVRSAVAGLFLAVSGWPQRRICPGPSGLAQLHPGDAQRWPVLPSAVWHLECESLTTPSPHPTPCGACLSRALASRLTRSSWAFRGTGEHTPASPTTRPLRCRRRLAILWIFLILFLCRVSYLSPSPPTMSFLGLRDTL